jgi:microcystin-dependent protein
MSSFSWCNDNPAGRVIPPDELVQNGFKSTTVGNNFWLNYLFWVISKHFQQQAGTYIKYAGASYPGALYCNGDTFGNAASSAIHASDDYEDLFYSLWGAGYAISGGQGATKEADWAANKSMSLPDRRGNISAGYSPTAGDIFNMPPGNLVSVGSEEVTLTVNEMPVINFTIKDPGHLHSYSGTDGFTYGEPHSPDPNLERSNPPEIISTQIATTGITINPIAGGGLAHNNVQPSTVINFFILY